MLQYKVGDKVLYKNKAVTIVKTDPECMQGLVYKLGDDDWAKEDQVSPLSRDKVYKIGSKGYIIKEGDSALFCPYQEEIITTNAELYAAWEQFHLGDSSI